MDADACSMLRAPCLETCGCSNLVWFSSYCNAMQDMIKLIMGFGINLDAETHVQEALIISDQET